MYWHSRPLRFVRYGKVGPPPWEEVWDSLRPAYLWLGQHTGYAPQVWFARGSRRITGYRSEVDSALFGFDILPGALGLAYDPWCEVISALSGGSWEVSLAELDQEIVRSLDGVLRFIREEGFEMNAEYREWEKHRDLTRWLDRFLFVGDDQYVLPQVNLKSSKEIWVRNERQKKRLRRLGFIEDRIKIRRVPKSRW